MYLQKAGFPIYNQTVCDYFAPGEQVFQELLPELRRAERYIFLEFFIIEEGVMWNAIHDILREKAAQGVEVRVLYDDMGCFLTLPQNYAKQLEAEGIRCRVFNPFRPILSSVQNNRDHRKIVSIDGRVAFTGGFNLADEYINVREKHGYLIVDDSMVSALTLAAKSGVDVRIITPHHWDKWLIHMTTRTYYRPLVEAGVKIYEYTPGFLHAKTFVSDDKITTVGPINLDYCSLSLHFECGVWMYGSHAAEQVKTDFLHTMAVSQEITQDAIRHGPLTRLFQELLRVVAPLM